MVKSQRLSDTTLPERYFVWSLLLAAGYILHDRQLWLHPDHGNDLYAGWAVLRGLVPYQDFHWIYGPLVPYLLAGGLLVFGESVRGLRILGLIGLIWGALLVGRLAPRIMSPRLAGLASLLTFACGFPYQHYHYPLVVPLVAGTMLILFRFLESGRWTWLVGLVISLVLLCGFKLNFGLPFATATLLVCHWFHRGHAEMPATVSATPCRESAWPSRWIPIAAGATGLLTMLVYLPFVWGLSGDRLKFCFPFAHLRAGDPGHPIAVWLTIPRWVFEDLASGRSPELADLMARGPVLTLIYGAMLLFCAPRAIRCLLKPAQEKSTDRTMAAIWLLTLVSGLEFLIRGTYYSLLQFAVVPTVCLVGWMLTPLAQRWHASWVWTIVGCGFLLVQVSNEVPHRSLIFDHPRGRVQLVPLDAARVLTLTCDFITKHVADDEDVAGFPYAPLFYFVAERRCGLWRHTYSRVWPPSEAEQREIIARIQQRPIRCVVLTNAIGAQDGFGVTYAQTVWRYLRENYVPVFLAGRGPWIEAPDHVLNQMALVIWRKGSRLPGRPLPWPVALPQ